VSNRLNCLLDLHKKIDFGLPTSTWSEWQIMVEQSGISNSELKQTTDILHGLGVVVHFNDKYKGLNDLIILDPQWLTKAIASIISLKNSMIRDRILKDTDWNFIWKNDPKIHQKLVDMLEMFQILYRVQNKNIVLGDCVGGSYYIILALFKSDRPRDLSLVWPKFDNKPVCG